MKIRSFLVILILILLFTGCSNKSIDNNESESIYFEPVKTTKLEPIPIGTKLEVDFMFPFIVWEDKTYEILLDQEIKQTKLDKEIGEAKRYISSTLTVTNEKFEKNNGDSNLLRKGAKIYKIKWKNIEKEIAVAYKGKFYIAKAK